MRARVPLHIIPPSSRNNWGRRVLQSCGGQGSGAATPKPQTPNPKPQTPNPKPQTPNPKPQVLRTLSSSTVELEATAHVILGMRVLQSFALLLLATSTKPHYLPCGITVEVVEGSQWVKIPLRRVATTVQVEKDDRAFDLLKKYTVDRFHFFCSQMDITRPFPSPCAADDAHDFFCWNSNMRVRFIMAGMSSLCPPLLCGAVHSHVPEPPPPPPPASPLKPQSSSSSSSSSSAAAALRPRMALAVIARKCCTHPGLTPNSTTEDPESFHSIQHINTRAHRHTF